MDSPQTLKYHRGDLEQLRFTVTLRQDGAALTDPDAVASAIEGAVWRFGVKRSYLDANSAALILLDSTTNAGQFEVAEPAEDGTVAVTVTLLPADYAGIPTKAPGLPYHWELEVEPAGAQGPTTLAGGDFVMDAGGEVIQANV